MEAAVAESKCTKCEFFKPLGEDCRSCELVRLRALVASVGPKPSPGRLASRLREPATLIEGEERRLGLLDEMAAIQTQLQTRRHAANGEPALEFREWRTKALRALQYVTGDYRRINEWVKRKRREVELSVASGDLNFIAGDTQSILRACLVMISGLVSDGVELAPAEKALLHALRDMAKQDAARAVLS